MCMLILISFILVIRASLMSLIEPTDVGPLIPIYIVTSPPKKTEIIIFFHSLFSHDIIVLGFSLG